MEKAASIAEFQDVSVFDVIENAGAYQELMRVEAKLGGFTKMIEALKIASQSMKLTDFVERVMRDTDYAPFLEREDTVESRTRLENLREFISVVAEYEKENEDATLGGLLEEVSLVADIDAYDEDQDAVVMMTIHSAKGLEFPVVFLTGMEEGLFPSGRCESDEDIEEERRLCYVAITRAKEKLYVTNTERRTIFGKTTPNRQSRFMREIPMEYTEDLTRKKQQVFGATNQLIQERAIRMRENLYKKPQTTITPSTGDIDFKAGDVVMHRKFGKGVVVAAQRFGKDMRLEVSFESVGTKQLMAAFARLEKIDE